MSGCAPVCVCMYLWTSIVCVYTPLNARIYVCVCACRYMAVYPYVYTYTPICAYLWIF